MKCAALGLSSASFVFALTAITAAQDAGPPPPKTPNAAPPTPESITPAWAPNPAAPNPAAPNFAPTTPQSPTTANGYFQPSTNFGWGIGDTPPPKEMPYTGGPIPYGYRYTQKYSLGLLISGSISFALGYGLAALSALDGDNGRSSLGTGEKPKPWKALYIPIAGPFAFANYAPDGSGFIYALEGITQVIGVGLLVGGITRQRDVLIRRDLEEAYRPQLHIGPTHLQLRMRF